MMQKSFFIHSFAERLRQQGIAATRQRLRIAKALFEHGGHPSAQDLFLLANRQQRTVCRATIYNTLNLFVSKGLIQEVSVDSSRTFYDLNIDPHHHIFNIDTGELLDVEPAAVSFKELPPLPQGTQQEEITLIIRVRNTRAAAPSTPAPGC
ncbi:MAG: transcriptional repressor [Gammaproteobacteria bacterium]|nr:transcriptional repressor [Gammaproteobacteria bacterium]MCP5424159.1 transcriptional repressor [Gammaproteobacteria bacterium]